MKLEVITRHALYNPNLEVQMGVSVGGTRTWVRVDEGDRWYATVDKLNAYKVDLLYEESESDPSKCLLLEDCTLFPTDIRGLYFLCPRRGIVRALEDPDHPAVSSIIQAYQAQTEE